MRFAAGCTITALLIFTPAWWELGVLVIGISTFWKPLSRLAHQVWQDWEMRGWSVPRLQRCTWTAARNLPGGTSWGSGNERISLFRDADSPQREYVRSPHANWRSLQDARGSCLHGAYSGVVRGTSRQED